MVIKVKKDKQPLNLVHLSYNLMQRNVLSTKYSRALHLPKKSNLKV